MRTFERTHPWISFRIDLRKAGPSLWLLLGEAASKCEHVAGKINELTPRLAKAYAGISAKTLQRDLAAVEEMGLVERGADGVLAKREVILAFLPWRRTET